MPDIRAEVLRRGLVAQISEATIWRWLAADAIAPWRHRSWIFPRDPDFEVKAGRVLDLYAGRFEGRRLGRGEYVVSADEKTSIQARIRCHPTLPPAPGRTMRVEHEYERGGALQYLAAWDVHRARLFGRCEPTTGIEPFGRLVAQVMNQPPYANARRVYWIVDNGSSHRGQASVERLETAWPNLRLIHLPIHASWLNQIEIYFSVIQRNDRSDQGGDGRCEDRELGRSHGASLYGSSPAPCQERRVRRSDAQVNPVDARTASSGSSVRRRFDAISITVYSPGHQQGDKGRWHGRRTFSPN